MIDALAQLNSMSRGDAIAAFTRCCGSSKWATVMCDSRPFASLSQMCDRADDVWESLGEPDYVEAFSHHPRIGDTTAQDLRFAGTREWSQKEQAGAASAPDTTREALARFNNEYFNKFGFVFLICATGKTAAEMLAELQRRLGNDRETELRNAAQQQRLITRLRLAKLVQET
jgi:2-oxo-4-hydroxy-4-carboxy-5-ureidoimidazoline decarboxylase